MNGSNFISGQVLKNRKKKEIGMVKGIYFQQQTDVFNKVSDSFESPKDEGQWVNLPTSPPIYQIHSSSTTTWFSKPVLILDLAQWRLFPQDSQSTVLGLLILGTGSFWSQLNSLILMGVSMDSESSMIYTYMIQRVKICDWDVPDREGEDTTWGVYGMNMSE